MDETMTNNAAEETTAPENTAGAEVSSEIDDDWDEIDLSGVKDDEDDGGNASEPQNEEQEPDADQPKEPESEDNAEEKGTGQDDAPKEQEAADQQLFELKHLGTVQNVNREQVIELAQKGLNWDHVAAERDEARKKFSELESFLNELAQPNNLTIEELIDQTRATMIAEKEGVDPSIAIQRVKLDRDRRAFEAQKQEADQKEQQKTAENQRVNASFVRFVKEYPDVDANSIPKEVWDAFREGVDLADAYRRVENKNLKDQVQQLQAEKEAAEQNAKNKERATGSQQTAGESPEKKLSEIDADWYDGT